MTVQRGQDNPLGIEQQIGVDLAKSYLEHKYAVEIVDAEPCSVQSDQKRLCVRFMHRTTDSGVDSAVEAFKTLIYTDSVAIIIGPTYSAQAEAAHKIANEAGVPVIAVSNTADDIVDPEYIARVSAPVAAYAFIALERLQDKKRIIVAYQNDDPFTLAETHAFTQGIKSNARLEWSVEPFTKNMIDFKPLAQKIRQANPDLVIVSARFGSGVALIQALRELGYTGLIIGGNGLNVNILFEACGQACDGMYIAQAYDPTQQETDVEKEFVEEYHAQGYVGFPSQITAQMFTALQLTIETLNGFEQVETLPDLNTLRNSLNQKLLTMKTGIATPLGYIWLDQRGEICQNEFYVAQVKIDRRNTTGYFDILRPSFPVANTFGELCYSE